MNDAAPRFAIRQIPGSSNGRTRRSDRSRCRFESYSWIHPASRSSDAVSQNWRVGRAARHRAAIAARPSGRAGSIPAPSASPFRARRDRFLPLRLTAGPRILSAAIVVRIHEGDPSREARMRTQSGVGDHFAVGVHARSTVTGIESPACYARLAGSPCASRRSREIFGETWPIPRPWRVAKSWHFCGVSGRSRRAPPLLRC